MQLKENLFQTIFQNQTFWLSGKPLDLLNSSVVAGSFIVKQVRKQVDRDDREDDRQPVVEKLLALSRHRVGWLLRVRVRV